jgi:pyruvate,water dikinase
MKYIRKFNEINKEDGAVVGGKGANLGEIFNAGLPVPDGFCITTTAYDEYFARNQLGAELTQEIMECYAALGHEARVAVRSSATAEDLPEASFAGQQESYLNVVGKEALFTAIINCYASLYSDRAVSYRQQANFAGIPVSLAVVVQLMIESEVSGVLFTADPIHHDTGHMMLNASWGLGEAIVSGKVTPDMYSYNTKQGRIVEEKLGSKDILIGYSAVGTEEKATTAEQKNRFCLSHKQAIAVFEMGRQIERHYGCPQDIEWALCDGKLFILQSRPITTLRPESEKHPELTAAQKAVLGNWIEHCPTPLYPLDVEPCEIVDKAKASVFLELGLTIGGELTMDDDGRLTLAAGKVRISPRIMRLPFQLRSFTSYANNSAHTKLAFAAVTTRLHEMEANEVSRLSVSALLEQLHSLLSLSQEVAYVRFRYSIFPSVIVAKQLTLTLRRINRSWSEFDLLSDLPYKTWELNVALQHLVAYIHQDTELKQAMMQQNLANHTMLTAIRNNFPDFSLKLQEFLQAFGWKSSSSYCAFGSVSWFEDMTPLFALIKALLQTDPPDAVSSKYPEMVRVITTRFSARKATRVIKRMEEIRGYHVRREESLYLIEHIYGLARRTVFELSHRFPDQFRQPKDILFLTLAEVYALPGRVQDNKNKMNTRKANRPHNERMWHSLSLGGRFDNEHQLTGISGNRGVCRGKVKKIMSLQEFEKMQPGDILVCRYTDPSWTPLFVLASAVVSDTGGPLSHSAIVAREYNIPAVLGCGNATAILQDGQEVVVDGDKGRVRIGS